VASPPNAPQRWTPVLLLLGFLLVAPPVLLFGPLAGLLLLARPRTLREWLWIAVSAAGSAIWLNQVGGLAGQFTRAGAVLLTGTFLALTVWRPLSRFSRTLSTTAIAGVALVIWMGHLGLGWTEVQRAIERDLWTYNHDVLARLRETSPGYPAGFLDQMASMVHTIGAFYPALLALGGIAGLRLAWIWHHRISRHPIGPEPERFTAFQFSDQLVWGWVVGLSLCLLPLPPFAAEVGGNLLLVWAVLYAVRGLAVFFAGSRRVPGLVMATLTLVAMFLLPFVLGGLTLLGLADTWLDFRRRLPASAT
jgi:Predicted membrane protein (DUF2232)